jgi:diguanylate cyclase (GGDEF)-like protein/PAS domain S-box-containing protein
MEMLGYAPGELAPHVDTFRALLHPDDAGRAAAALDAHLAGRVAEYALEVRLRTKAGGWRWVLCRGEVVARDAGGAPVRMVGTNLDIEERKALEAELVHQAGHDALTGLANRARFRARAERALGRADRPADSVAVLFLDLDDFKAVNDTRGHAAGDRLLALVAERLLNATRGCDTVARLGGDEFAVLLENVRGDADALAVATRAAAAMRTPFELDGRAGVGRGERGDRARDERRHGGHAAPERGPGDVRAKRAGKGRHETFSPGDARRARRPRRATPADLRQCVAQLGRDARDAERDAEPTSAPRLLGGVPADGGARVRPAGGLEAARRAGTTRQRGPVGPAEFIGLAEESGDVEPLGRWVLREACREAARWDAGPDRGQRVRGGGGGRLAPCCTLNVSSRQLEAATFLGDVTDALATRGSRRPGSSSRSPRGCSCATRRRRSPGCTPSRRSACASPSTTSARATRRSRTSSGSPSTSSRSTRRSSTGCSAVARTPHWRAR